MSNELTSTRPYLIRAMHEWMSDNGQTPLIIVDAVAQDVVVPDEYVEDDSIVLNISWSATRNLTLDNDVISFEARFSGTPRTVTVPVASVKGIYARESGQGMMFQDEPSGQKPAAAAKPAADSGGEPNGTGDGGRPAKGRPGLKLVK